MMFFDITDSSAINGAFTTLAMQGSHNNEEFKTFGQLFWAQLTDENKKLYRWAYPVVMAPLVEGIDYEAAILSRQENSGRLD